MKKTKLYVIIIIAIFIIGLTGKVNAENVTFKATADSQALEEGEEVVITLNLSNINVNEDGIYTFGGKLVYDKNVFEEVKEEKFEGQNNWSIAYNSEHTEKEGTFLATKNTGLKDNQTIGTLTLKTKRNIKSTTTQIKFIDISSVGEDTIELDDEIITLNITGTKKDEVDDKNNNTPDDNNGKNEIGNSGNSNNDGDNSGNSGNSNNDGDNSGNSGNGNSNGDNSGNSSNGSTTITIKNPAKPNQSIKDTTTSENKIPQTGVENIAIVIAGIVILTIMIVAYIKYKKNLDIK